MARSNAGRSTTGGPLIPYYPRGGVIEAAKYLRLKLTQLINSTGGTSARDVEEAIAIWHQAIATAAKNEEE